MSDRSRWDPEMRAYQSAAEAIAAKYPPVKLELPLEPHRLVNDAISLGGGAWTSYLLPRAPSAHRSAVARAGVFSWRRLGVGLGRHA